MSRYARKKSSSNFYHVMVRGINQSNIFHDDEDRVRYLETLKRMKETGRYSIHGYCLMDNHIHLIIQEGNESIAVSMKRIGVSYVYYYNHKYERSGHLFQDRFLSENIEDDGYILTVLRYIHQNPVKAGMVDHVNQYKWSSNGAYEGCRGYPEGLVETGFILGTLGNDSDSLQKYKKLMEETDDNSYLCEPQSKRISDEKAKEVIEVISEGIKVEAFGKLEKDIRSNMIKKIKEET